MSLASGLEPPPHLVGERARALDVLARGGLVCASALAVAELMPPPNLAAGAASRSPAATSRASTRWPKRSSPPATTGSTGSRSAGQIAVRGGLVDVFPTTGREPLRIEFFGDEIESIRAFSPFTQRALREVDEARIYPAAERIGGTGELTLPDDEKPGEVELPADLVAPFATAPDFVWQPDEVRAVWRDEGFAGIPLEGSSELDPFPQGQPHSFEAQRPALVARGLSEAENELGGLLRQGLDVIVAFAHRGEAERRRALLRRVEAGMLSPGDEPAGLAFAVTPARRGFVWRELGVALLPDTQVFRRRPPRQTAAPGRALASFSDLRTSDYVVHEDHGISQLLGFETREVAGVTRDYLLLGFRGEDRVYVPARADRQGLALHRRGLPRAHALEARRQGVGQPQEPRPRAPPGDGRGAPHSSTPSARPGSVSPTTSTRNGSNGSRPTSPTARPKTRRARSRP